MSGRWHCGMYGMKEKPIRFKSFTNNGYVCNSCNNKFKQPNEVDMPIEGIGSQLICPYCASNKIELSKR